MPAAWRRARRDRTGAVRRTLAPLRRRSALDRLALARFARSGEIIRGAAERVVEGGGAACCCIRSHRTRRCRHGARARGRRLSAVGDVCFPTDGRCAGCLALGFTHCGDARDEIFARFRRRRRFVPEAFALLLRDRTRFEKTECLLARRIGAARCQCVLARLRNARSAC